MAITQQDIDVVRQLLNVYETTAVRHGMDETEFIAFKLGGISTSRAQRLIIATKAERHNQGASNASKAITSRGSNAA